MVTPIFRNSKTESKGILLALGNKTRFKPSKEQNPVQMSVVLIIYSDCHEVLGLVS